KKEKEKKKKEKEEAKEKKKKEKKDNRPVEEAVVEDFGDVTDADLVDGELTIDFEPGTMWNEDSMIKKAANYLEVVKAVFDFDDDIDSTLIQMNVEMVDEKGNEDMRSVINYRYPREDFNELNYDKFTTLALGEPYRVLQQAESYYIHPGIFTELSDEYKHELTM